MLMILLIWAMCATVGVLVFLYLYMCARNDHILCHVEIEDQFHERCTTILSLLTQSMNAHNRVRGIIEDESIIQVYDIQERIALELAFLNTIQQDTIREDEYWCEILGGVYDE